MIFCFDMIFSLFRVRPQYTLTDLGMLPFGSMRTAKKILVVGDLILDALHQGVCVGNSLEHAKTPLVLGQSSSFLWGGAGLLVRNILTLGGVVSFISALGVDEFAEKADQFTHPRLKKLFLRNPHNPTTVKQRFCTGESIILNWHQFDNAPLPKALADALLARVRAELPSASKVMILDARHGLLTSVLVQKIIEECTRRHIPLYIDSQVYYNHTGNHLWYKGASLFSLNLKEARSIDSNFDLKKTETSLARLQKILHAKDIVVKLGAQGSVALIGEDYIKTRAHRVREVDATGAGDSFMGALALGGASPTREDLERANVWAALSTTKIGTTLPPLSALKTHLKKYRSNH